VTSLKITNILCLIPKPTKGASKMKVLLQTRSEGNFDWNKEIRQFVQIPFVGEYVALTTNSAWYKVQLVVHTPFPCDYDAEVYAVEVDSLELTKQAFGHAQTTSYMTKLASHAREGKSPDQSGTPAYTHGIRFYPRHGSSGELFDATYMDTVLEALKKAGIAPDSYNAPSTNPSAGYYSYTTVDDLKYEKAREILNEFNIKLEE
jgi:hypothetical protein